MAKRDSLAGTIDGATGFPLHRQVGAVLRNQIANGEYRVGDQLPTEGALGDQFGVSRATIRMALRALEAEGLLTRRRALGTFLKALPRDRQAWPSRPVVALADLVRQPAGRCLHLRQGHVRPPASVAAALALPATAEVLYCTKAIAAPGRRRFGIKHYFAPVLEPFVTPDLLKAADFTAALHVATGKGLRHRRGWVEAILVEPHMLLFLDVAAGTPLLSVWSLATLDGKPALLTQMLRPGNEMAGGFDVAG